MKLELKLCRVHVTFKVRFGQLAKVAPNTPFWLLRGTFVVGGRKGVEEAKEVEAQRAAGSRQQVCPAHEPNWCQALALSVQHLINLSA